ncbi:hypothetical protein RO3G_01611 [Lichtheimia corymbifera JMRC:FSU:9682]|uniref:Reverse transcriptase domain-containing protein n=1 Tax=Lichtheimia corymbifera JMRC:FSU:9682 TaxID=1263082 RepID=A0A068SFE9_9FUNG|nr:hypothetical protein RO3G_01611 [Lichtheimia corymbifera JMRC:FSU:9682]
MLSYADDLEVFLTSPHEWPILLDTLGQSHQASNAKVNLTKTIVMPLSGITNQEWAELASEYGAQWHDSQNPTAVRYLGYPLYHTKAQLWNFLDDLKSKIARHAQILKSRNLSLRGASTVANSLLLSRLWHIMRVVPVPQEWRKEIQNIVQSFLMPFWPKPAWSTPCLPRRFGGVGLIDITDQSLALHLIYLQRICKAPKATDFVSPWLVKYYQILTGHASLLPWFLFPAQFQSRMKADPNMAHLGLLLQRLPPLSLSAEWSQRWLLDLDLPLQLALPSENRLKLPLRYLLSDIVKLDLSRQCFLFHPHRLPPLLTELIHSLRPSNRFSPSIITLNDSIILSIPANRLLAPVEKLYFIWALNDLILWACGRPISKTNAYNERDLIEYECMVL